MKVIFLDIDGVLINAAACAKGYGVVDSACVAALNQLVAETNAGIVVSSCWRIGLNVVELRELLKEKWGVRAPVFDRTPNHNGAYRGGEIQAWLDTYNQARSNLESFVIIDDDTDMGADLLPRLVRTDFVAGLTPDTAARAAKILKEWPCR